MTPDEIQALRERHINDGHGCCNFCTDGRVWAADYPCDVIQVLDAWEAERKVQACDHLMPDPITGLPSKASEWGHIFCPKCGIKLKEGN